MSKFRIDLSKRFRYRVWDGYSFLSSDRVSLSPDGTLLITGGGRTNLDAYVVQQWTGLVDKNGKDVYEGDIVEYFDRYYANGREDGLPRTKIEWQHKPYGNTAFKYIGFSEIGVVEWDNEACTWSPTISSTDDYNNNSFAYVCRDCSAANTEPDSFYRVIGNIFENPDLFSQINKE